MAKPADFDLAAAHKFFSADCFNQAWYLIDKPSRSAEEDETMLELCLAALWHWRQRQDCTSTNLSIGYWQAARIYTLLNQVDNARHYAQLCLEVSQMDGVAPFYLGYACEALARAEAKAGDAAKAKGYIREARRIMVGLADLQEKQQLEDDLDSIG